MKIGEALDYWITEGGYRRIGHYLSKRIHGVSKYPLQVSDRDEQVASLATETIIGNMNPETRRIMYYRGDVPLAKRNDHRREGFISVTHDKEQAQSFLEEECCVFTLIVDADVLRIRSPVEGETILEPECYWENSSDTSNLVYLHSPSWTPPPSKDFPWLGDVLEQESERTRRTVEIAQNVLEKLIKAMEDEDEDMDMDDLKVIYDYDIDRLGISESVADYVWMEYIRGI